MTKLDEKILLTNIIHKLDKNGLNDMLTFIRNMESKKEVKEEVRISVI